MSITQTHTAYVDILQIAYGKSQKVNTSKERPVLVSWSDELNISLAQLKCSICGISLFEASCVEYACSGIYPLTHPSFIASFLKSFAYN